jgi:hypothetical protein
MAEVTERSPREDPIGDRFFKPLEQANKCADGLFYLTAVLSFLTLMVNRESRPVFFAVVQASFVLAVIVPLRSD